MTAIAERTLTSDLHDLVTSELARWKVPGMSIATWKDGEVQTAAFGLANTETGQPVTPGTVFQIGSITKTFTATAVMQLVERWKLELDQPVARYLPGFRLGDGDATEALTVRHLLTHTGGFWGDDFTDYGIGDDALQKAVDALSGIRQLTRPGELWFYCNAGFQVLGRLIEQATHKPYEDVIRDRIFKPLEMERSTFWAHEAITYPVAVGYNTITTDEPETARPYAITRAMAAAGTIIGTPTDLLKFAAFHLGDGMANGKRLLSKSTLAAMQRPHVEAANMAAHWGLGWWLQDAAGVTTFGHGGSTNGHRALLTVCPEQRFAVAILTNGSNGAAAYRSVERFCLEHYAGVRRVDPPVVPLPADDLAKYAGTYRNAGGEIVVGSEAGGLTLDVTSRNALTGQETALPRRHASPVSAREFIITDTETQGSVFDFVPHADDSVRFLRLGGRLYLPEATL
jgi:CubicO group peptidase (beta-lactamase class C family)